MTDPSRRAFLQRMTAAGLVVVAAPAIVRASSLEAIPVRHAWALPASPVRWAEVLTINNLGSDELSVYSVGGTLLCRVAPGQTVDLSPYGLLVSGLRLVGGDGAVAANDLPSAVELVRWHYRGIARSLRGPPVPGLAEISWIEFDQ